MLGQVFNGNVGNFQFDFNVVLVFCGLVVGGVMFGILVVYGIFDVLYNSNLVLVFGVYQVVLFSIYVVYYLGGCYYFWWGGGSCYYYLVYVIVIDVLCDGDVMYCDIVVDMMLV